MILLVILGVILLVAFFVGRKVANMFGRQDEDGGEEYIMIPRHQKNALVGYEDIRDENIVPMRDYNYYFY